MRHPRRVLALVVLVFLGYHLLTLYTRTGVPSGNAAESPAGDAKQPVPAVHGSKQPDSSSNTKADPKVADAKPADSKPVDSSSTGEHDAKQHAADAPTHANAKPAAQSPLAKDSKPSPHAGSSAGHKDSDSVSEAGVPDQLPGYKAGMKELSKIIDHMLEVHPDIGTLNDYSRDLTADNFLYGEGELAATSTQLGMYLQVNENDVKALKKAHAEVVTSLPQDLPANTFKGRGIVMTGGGKYFPLVVSSIKWLREVNTNLPVEVFMQDESEWEPVFCDEVFPKMNVKCVNIEAIYGKELLKKVNSKYALKPLALLASQFEEVYFMDADSLPLDDPEPLFSVKPYTKTGMVVNNDYWERYISPHYFEVAGIQLGGRARGPPDSPILKQSDRENAIPGLSTESGQMIFDKKRHIRSLMLTLYYNIFGASTYFPLLMQGGPGEGDKDTYTTAASVLDEEYYSTQRRPVTLGYNAAGGGFRGFAMVQPHPGSDYARLHEKLDEPEIFFNLHSNSIKANPRLLLIDHDEHLRGFPPLQHSRYYGRLPSQRKETLRFNDDVELRYFGCMADVVCDWARQKKWVPRDWKDEDLERMCGYLVDQINWLKDPANDEEDRPAEGQYNVDVPFVKVPEWKSTPSKSGK